MNNSDNEHKHFIPLKVKIRECLQMSTKFSFVNFAMLSICVGEENWILMMLGDFYNARRRHPRRCFRPQYSNILVLGWDRNNHSTQSKQGQQTTGSTNSLKKLCFIISLDQTTGIPFYSAPIFQTRVFWPLHCFKLNKWVH